MHRTLKTSNKSTCCLQRTAIVFPGITSKKKSTTATAANRQYVHEQRLSWTPLKCLWHIWLPAQTPSCNVLPAQTESWTSPTDTCVASNRLLHPSTAANQAKTSKRPGDEPGKELKSPLRIETQSEQPLIRKRSTT